MRYYSLVFFVIMSLLTYGASPWRSALYPEDWQPGYADSEGRFLHDFSYAGYHGGLIPIPHISKNIVDVTNSPYKADNSGRKDATDAIQRAIDDVSRKGGGVVFLPQGEYIISVKEGQRHGLAIKNNNVVVRGAGAGKTFLKNTTTFMKNKSVIRIYSDRGSWDKPVLAKQSKLAGDISYPVTTISVEDASVFHVGDLVVLATDMTKDFIEEHKSTGMWSTKIRGLRLCRTVVALDPAAGTIEIDVPTRYFMKLRDNARVYAIDNLVQDCGIEELSIGNIQSPLTEGWTDLDCYKEGTAANSVHASYAVRIDNAQNCWLRNVATYRPKENKDDFHLVSNGVLLSNSRFVTIERCDFQKPQYEGGGGNGYMYRIEGNDCLLKDCHAEHGRHNYDFSHLSCSGNVLLRCSSKEPKYSTDFHMGLSIANLIDSFVSDGDYLETLFRQWGSNDYIHSYTATECVFWNTKGVRGNQRSFLIASKQWKWGYVIGTSGCMNRVVTSPVSGELKGWNNTFSYDTSPEDWVEGVGQGESLMPQSLYESQLKKRIQRCR